MRKGGELDLQDSTSTAMNGADLVSAYGAKHVKIAYSTFTGAHCGLHIEPSESFEIDHVTSDSNIFGITIYGSGAGPNIVKASNFTGSSRGSTSRASTARSRSRTSSRTASSCINGGPVPPTVKKATAAIADAKPR